MKKIIIKAVAMVMAITLLAMVLVSCGGALSGTYSSDVGIGDAAGAKTSYTFSGSKVTVTVTTTVLGVQSSNSYEGKYEIIDNSDDTQSIKFTFEDANATSYSGTYSFVKSEDSIKIGLFTYTK